MKVAIYIRLSKEDEHKTNEESESIVNQKAMLTAYACEKDWEIYKVYSDEDYSGSDITRPAFNEMLRDAERGEFQILLCKSLSRFARDVATVETYIHGKFIEWGIRFVSPTDYADSGVKGSRKNIQINSLVNQWYLEDLSENIKSVMTHKKKQGQFVGSFAPYGYIKDPNDKHKLIIDDESSLVVKRIFSMYLEGYGFNAIAKQLNEEGIPCPSKYRYLNGIKSNRSANTNIENLKWSDHTVWHITCNPNYTGDLVQCRYGKPSYKSKSLKSKPPEEWVIVEGVHEPIISKEEYNQVQKMKKTRGAYSRSKKSTVTTPVKENAFAGLLKCKLCGRSMVMSTSGASNGFTRYFRCTGKKSRVAECNCAMVKYDIVEEIVTSRVKTLIKQYCDFSTAEKYSVQSELPFETMIKTILKASEQNSAEQMRLDKALSDSYIDRSIGAITLDAFTTISKNLEAQKEELKLSQKSIQERLEVLYSKRNSVSEKRQISSKYADFTELTREVASAFIETIYIGERDRVRHYKEPQVKHNRKTAKQDFYIEIVWNF